MSKKRTFGKFLVSLAKYIALLAFCALIAFIVTVPLWTLAVKVPSIYTALVLGAIFIFIIFSIVRKISSSSRKSRK